MSYNIKNTVCDAFTASMPSCIKTLVIPTTIALAELTIYFTDKFGKEYSLIVESDAEGLVSIDLSLFPAGIFNPYYGTFTIFATLSGFPKSERIAFNGEDAYYKTIELEVIDSYPLNYYQFASFNLDTGKFICCCTTVKPKCPENCIKC